jgi:anti-anti-sigma factor
VVAQWRSAAIGREAVIVDGRPARSGIRGRFDRDQAMLPLRGEVNLFSAPQLGVFFDAVTASGYPSVVLDLTGMDSIDAVGLTVIVTSANTLVASGGQLTIRSSLSEIARVLDGNWLAGLISPGLGGPSRERLGPEQPTMVSATSLRVALPDGAHHLRKLKAAPTNKGTVRGALRLVVALAATMVGGAHGASLTLWRHGRFATVAASDQTISDMDSEQYATGEGPCVDASVEGRWFHAQSLEDETRWPAFTPRAQALGIGAILSSPLLTQGESIGSLNIYSRARSAFAVTEQELAAIFAAEASNILSDAAVTDDQLTGRFQRARRTREVIAEARRFSQLSDRSLRERAEDVLGSSRRSQRALAPKGSLA